MVGCACVYLHIVACLYFGHHFALLSYDMSAYARWDGDCLGDVVVGLIRFLVCGGFAGLGIFLGWSFGYMWWGCLGVQLGFLLGFLLMFSVAFPDDFFGSGGD